MNQTFQHIERDNFFKLPLQPSKAFFITLGLPPLIPLCLADSSPAFTLSWIKDLSNWANAPNIWKNSSLEAVVVPFLQ